MKHIVVILTIVLCLSVLVKNEAQNQIEDFSLGEGWKYQEQCLVQAENPPNDWSWDGTILLRGSYGIHGLNHNWDTTRVLAFIRNANTFSGSLSPDGMWLVTVGGERECGGGIGCGYTRNNTDSLQIYYLASNQSRTAYTIAWNYNELTRHTLQDVAVPTWINNTEFVYGGEPPNEQFANLSLVNVETRSVSEWTGRSDILYPRTISPDLSRGFNYENIVNLETGEILGNLQEQGVGVRLYPYETGALWSPNSAYFLVTDNAGERQERLLLYSREGQYLGHILTALRLSSFTWSENIYWSPNGEKFLFRTWIAVEDGLNLSNWYIVDIAQETVFDLCANNIQATWSSDGAHLALNWHSQLSILDSNFNHYLIWGDSSGYGIFGWRLSE